MHLKPLSSRPCFIVGCPRSGTTLLSVMLDRHPDLAILPETCFYDEIAPYLSTNCDLARRLASWSRLPELGLTIDAVLKKSGTQPTRARLFSALLELYAQARGKPRGGEKTPTHLKHVSSIMNDFPGTVVICLIRDGRDVALSLRSMPWFGGDLAAAAWEWLRAVELMLRFEKIYPRRFTVVRYENLVAAPVDTLGSIMNSIGLEFQPGQLLPTTSSSVVMSRSLEWKGQALKETDKSLAQARRTQASSSDLGILDHLLGEALLRLHY